MIKECETIKINHQIETYNCKYMYVHSRCMCQMVYNFSFSECGFLLTIPLPYYQWLIRLLLTLLIIQLPTLNSGSFLLSILPIHDFLESCRFIACFMLYVQTMCIPFQSVTRVRKIFLCLYERIPYVTWMCSCKLNYEYS